MKRVRWRGAQVSGLKRLTAHPSLFSKETKMTWRQLNDLLRGADEKECRILLRREKKGKKRIRFIARIHSRLNRVRAMRERKELGIYEDLH